MIVNTFVKFKKKYTGIMEKADIAIIGLAVMGRNLILNIDSKGFKVCAFNRTTDKVDQFLETAAKGTNIIGATSLSDMVEKLKVPRLVMILVKAGSPVDDFIRQLIPLLSTGDIIIDGGNSEYTDTQRRCQQLEKEGILFVGAGISGGEEGARLGPSLMPGGNKNAWHHIKPIFQSICAKSGSEPCCDWVGDGGAGHFVKMVHNGIEYGDMQLICEAYHLMKNLLRMNNEEMAETFEKWNQGELESFLIQITKDILRFKDDDGKYLLDKILDSAGQKGTGKWTAIAALEFGVPVTLIGEAVFARCLSSLKSERKIACMAFKRNKETVYQGDKIVFVNKIQKALYASKIISYAQGFILMKEAAKLYNWELNYGRIALLWRGGCIIRNAFLENIRDAYKRCLDLPNLLLDQFFVDAIVKCQDDWREVVSEAVLLGVPVPTMSSALAFFDGYSSDVLPANLIQAQRDYFGAHTYEILGAKGKFVHTNWTGRGGDISASAYNN